MASIRRYEEYSQRSIAEAVKRKRKHVNVASRLVERRVAAVRGGGKVFGQPANHREHHTHERRKELKQADICNRNVLGIQKREIEKRDTSRRCASSTL